MALKPGMRSQACVPRPQLRDRVWLNHFREGSSHPESIMGMRAGAPLTVPWGLSSEDSLKGIRTQLPSLIVFPGP